MSYTRLYGTYNGTRTSVSVPSLLVELVNLQDGYKWMARATIKHFISEHGNSADVRDAMIKYIADDRLMAKYLGTDAGTQMDIED